MRTLPPQAALLLTLIACQPFAAVAAETSQLQTTARLTAKMTSATAVRTMYSFGPCNITITNPVVQNNANGWGTEIYVNAGVTCTSGVVTSMDNQLVRDNAQHTAVPQLTQAGTGTSSTNLYNNYFCNSTASHTWRAYSNVVVTVGSTHYQTEVGSASVALNCF